MEKELSIAVAVAAVLSGTAALAQKMGDEGMDMGTQPGATKAAAKVHHVSGVVKAVDANANLVTLVHDPVKSLNWPAMTMKFQVKDKALLDKLAVGTKVEFDFEQSGKGYVVTAIK